jgi:hydrogenase maturation protease
VSDAGPAPGVLVIGVGNDLRGDDSAGLEVARRLRGVGDGARAGVGAPLAYDGDGAGLLDLWQGARAVVLVDAISSGAPAGTIHRFDASATARAAHGSTHAIGLADAIELARVLRRLPPRVLVYGVVGERFGAGAALSEAVAAALAPLADAVRDEALALALALADADRGAGSGR